MRLLHGEFDPTSRASRSEVTPLSRWCLRDLKICVDIKSIVPIFSFRDHKMDIFCVFFFLI